MIKLPDDQNWTCIDVDILGVRSHKYTYVTEAARDTITDIKHDIFWSAHFSLVIECILF